MTKIEGRFSRRTVLRGGAALAATAAVSPYLVFRAHAAPAKGELAMIAGTPNPKGALEKLYLLKGDPLAGPIQSIVTETGASVPASGLEQGERRLVRLLHFNDMHNHITEMHAKKGDTHVFSQMVKQVKALRAGAAADEVVLFISGGDDHTGSIFDELMGWSPKEFIADAGYRVYSAGGVDVAVLGNHEFDRGAEVLKKGIATDARFPLLSANVHGSAFLKRDDDYVAAAIGEVKGLRIGFVGLTTSVDTRVGQPADPGLAVASPLDAVRNVLPALASITDMVVVLSHCGYGSEQHKSGKAGTTRTTGEGDFAIAETIAPLTDKPIVIIGAHTHTKLNAEGIDPHNMVEGVLITQAQAHGAFLGEIVMSIRAENGRKGWFSSVGLRPTKSRDERVKAGEPGFEALEQEEDYDVDFEQTHVAPLIKALDTRLNEVIGQVPDDQLVSTKRTFADRYVGETALANFMNDALVKRSENFPNGRIDIALFNASGLASGLSQGSLNFRQWYDVMPYADGVHVATMTGAQIRDMLTSNARRILRPEEVDKIDASAFVSRGFLHFSSALRYAIKLNGSAREAEAVDITIAGKSIEHALDQDFKVAFNTYVALGGFGETWNGKPVGGDVPGQIPSMDLRSLPFDHTGMVYRNEVVAMIREVRTVGVQTGVALDQRVRVVR
ncbi:Mannosylglucosyl-3-phosphoglycerate phosphatase [Ensifer sp. M14]|uniref:bifunctional metallophosphatase/5'-nucleotidase n=1 Tax=Ensifer sp. M14 TaxID=2203782 RepID=UPI000E1DB656|nr:5'-nucleotidase C-terminal domain-containing protein [Ensifer sp. M14]RDL47500.1 Mannosylglucosyl-3-phosphoglycerate phosphatase [Ensifer sp. M14]